MRSGYKKTVYACFGGYIIQAVINNFLPLLFIMLETSYEIPLRKITSLITVNFGVQLAVDMLSVLFISRIGYRISITLAHAFSAAGLILLMLLPDHTGDPYIGILISVIVYAVGGGLIEVLISPIMEGCPTDNKKTAMSLLHSFYCWGQVLVVLASTLFFKTFGIENWRIISLVWAALPIINGIVFLRTPLPPLVPEGEREMKLPELFKNGNFWILMIMMMCAGASELSVSQWASAFAESGLGISKAAGDLAGPMMFAVLMGSARALYGKFGSRIDLGRFMKASCVLCIVSYLVISLCPSPVLSLVGCALCGLSVGIMWPGTFSSASASILGGGSAMFALLALAGDVGCSFGPSLVGMVSESSGSMKLGILSAAAFPLVLLAAAIFCRTERKNG